MNIAAFIAKRVAFNKQRSFSRFIIRLATIATAVSVAAMIITVSFVNGFQHTISQKVFSFWGHIRVQQFEPNKAIVAEETPLVRNDTVARQVSNTPGVKQVQAFATKSAILHKDQDIEGVLFKGVEENYDFNNLQPFLKAGKWVDFKDPQYSRQIVISELVAKSLNIKVNDSLSAHFISPEQGKSIPRKLQVCGIFKTGIEEYDKLFALGDIRLLRRINNWKKDEIGGYEIFLDDYRKMDAVNEKLYDSLPGAWVSKTIKQIQPNIFDWLNIQDVNRNMIFIIMTIVAIINLITCLLILVLDRTRMIGTLKALGTRDWTIQEIFLYHSSIISAKGIGFGLLAGLGICLLQQWTGFIRLDESAYYVSVAPILIKWWQVIMICVVTLVVCFLALIIPTLLIRFIQPVKAIQFR